MVDYQKVGQDIGTLVEKKQKAYGDSFGRSGEILEILYPDGIPPSKYKNVLAIIRIIDKLFRIATDEEAFNEEPWKDICGYALLMISKNSVQMSPSTDKNNSKDANIPPLAWELFHGGV